MSYSVCRFDMVSKAAESCKACLCLEGARAEKCLCGRGSTVPENPLSQAGSSMLHLLSTALLASFFHQLTAEGLFLLRLVLAARAITEYIALSIDIAAATATAIRSVHSYPS